MDVFKLYRNCFNRLRLFVLYWRRIVFALNHMKVGFYKAAGQLCGGFWPTSGRCTPWTGRKRKEYLSEFDWYRSRYINESL